MRIALVHSFYSSEVPSGENTVVRDQVELLRQAGHDVLLVSRNSDDAGPAHALRAAATVASGIGPDPTDELSSFGPDVVHVHNLFPNFGTRWLRGWPGPLVATLHNYRPMCANALFLRDGHNCTLCPDHGSHNAVRFKCYRDSVVATAPLAFRNRRGLTSDAVVSRADRLIVLSPRAESLYLRYGAARELLLMIPNGLFTATATDPAAAPADRPRDGWVAAGRITPEKGLRPLMDWWPADQALSIFGEGPDRGAVSAAAGPLTTIAGQIPASELRVRLGGFEGSIFSGTAWEGGIPMTLVESLAQGTPIVARRGGVAATVVERFGCGAVFDTPGTLIEALADIRDNGEKYQLAAFRTFTDYFGPEQWLAGLQGAYAGAIAHRAA